MTGKPSSFGAFAIVGGLVLTGALLWYGPWLSRAVTERLSLYRMCLEWSRASETLGQWTQTHVGCLGQVSRRRSQTR